MPERNTGVGADNRIELRIGINLGDVIVEGDDLYGDAADGAVSWTSVWHMRSHMREVGAFEAKNRLGALLDQVERGEEIVITRRGKPVAKLVPAGPDFDRAKARRAVAGLLEASRGVTLGGLKIRDLISEGRS